VEQNPAFPFLLLTLFVLTHCLRIEIHPNELYESTEVQDIPAGSITQQIILKEFDQEQQENSFLSLPHTKTKSMARRKGSKIDRQHVSSSYGGDEDSVYSCRYLCTKSLDTLIPIEVDEIWKRGVRYSNYDHIYAASPHGLSNDDNCETGLLVPKNDPYSIAITQLHVSFVPETMPCRQEEHQRILDFILRQLRPRHGTVPTVTKKRGRGTSGGKDHSNENQTMTSTKDKHTVSAGREPLYLSGMTGTGKTATVLTALTSLSKLKHELSLPEYGFIEINGLRLSSPQEAYTLLWKGMSGEQVASRTALQRLKEYFTERSTEEGGGGGGGGGGTREHDEEEEDDDDTSVDYFICLLDELDFLMTSHESVIYNLLEWSQSPHSGLILIGIANTMDLPDRLNKKSQSRMGGGGNFQRISFRPYTFDQILQILTHRLENLKYGIFDKKILELVARKAAACSGDLRSALKICQRAIELHRDQQRLVDGTNTSTSTSMNMSHTDMIISSVSLQMVTRAAIEYREDPLMIATRYACDLDIAIFLALSKHTKNTGMSHLTLLELWDDCQNIIISVGVHGTTGPLLCPPWPVFKEAICRLLDQGLLLASDRPSVVPIGTFHPNDQTKFQTNLSYNDVLVALRDGKNQMAIELFPYHDNSEMM
jgi:Cdc6-like AAA superfamily ATPase